MSQNRKSPHPTTSEKEKKDSLRKIGFMLEIKVAENESHL